MCSIQGCLSPAGYHPGSYKTVSVLGAFLDELTKSLLPHAKTHVSAFAGHLKEVELNLLGRHVGQGLMKATVEKRFYSAVRQ